MVSTCFQGAAQTRLGIANATGWGGFAVNDFAAFRYFTQAAEQGFGEAICWVAECFAEGRGVERSAEQAYAQVRRRKVWGNLCHFFWPRNFDRGLRDFGHSMRPPRRWACQRRNTQWACGC